MLQLIFNFFFIYFITFWIVIFLVLPFGVKTEDSPLKGNDKGAPKYAMIKKKFIITAILTFILVCVMFYINHIGLVTSADILGEENL
jgi:predicted secreted protein